MISLFTPSSHAKALADRIKRAIAAWHYRWELDRNLRARRVLRPQRQAAARKGVQTRKARA